MMLSEAKSFSGGSFRDSLTLCKSTPIHDPDSLTRSLVQQGRSPPPGTNFHGVDLLTRPASILTYKDIAHQSAVIFCQPKLPMFPDISQDSRSLHPDCLMRGSNCANQQ